MKRRHLIRLQNEQVHGGSLAIAMNNPDWKTILTASISRSHGP